MSLSLYTVYCNSLKSYRVLKCSMWQSNLGLESDSKHESSRYLLIPYAEEAFRLGVVRNSQIKGKCTCLGVRMEKAMAPHFSTLTWKIPWTEEPGRLWSMGSQRVRHNWVTSLSLFTFMHWRRKWQPTPVFLPGESQGQGSLVGCHLWSRTELDTTEAS